MNDLLDKLGALGPGFAGALVAAFINPDTTPLRAVLGVVVGTLTAAFVGPYAVAFVPSGGTDEALGAVSFALGLGAMKLLPVILTLAEQYTKRIQSYGPPRND